MISNIPGWLNYLLLSAFYYALFTLLDWWLGLGVSRIARVIFSMLMAGGYLSKWREKQGGGWRFW